MSVKKSLKVISGGNNHEGYAHEKLIESLKGSDEFTKYRTKKEISKFKNKILGQIKSEKASDNVKEQYYLEDLIQIYKRLPFECQLILYGEAEGMLKCLE